MIFMFSKSIACRLIIHGLRQVNQDRVLRVPACYVESKPVDREGTTEQKTHNDNITQPRNSQQLTHSRVKMYKTP
jgi:hypothetical protein